MRIEPRVLEEIRSRVTLSDIIGQSTKLKRTGRSWQGLCTLHGETGKNGWSFNVDDGKQSWKCFACNERGDIFRWLQLSRGLSFMEAVEQAASLAGVALPKMQTRPRSREEIEEERRRREAFERKTAEKRRQQERDERRRLDVAAEIWKATVPLRGSMGERYFEARGIDPSRVDGESIRFSSGLVHGDVEGRFPGIVCKAVDKEGRGRGVWRIYLRADCGDKAFSKESGIPSKLGKGVASGCAVRIGGLAPAIGVAEGVETACAVRELNDWRIPVWSLMSTSGFGSCDPPALVSTIYIFSDSDLWRKRPDGTWAPPPGDRAANALMELLKGKFELKPMPKPEHGDWNDVLQKIKERAR